MKLRNYLPLAVLVVIAALAASALCYGSIPGNRMSWMHYFMGLLFCQFALLKLFDVEGFADGFQMYDLVGKQSRQYAVAYPFIELALGLAYLSFVVPVLTYLVTIVLLALSAIGVVLALRKGLKTNCACMGTSLKVPLSTVTLVEDIGMGLMALLMLISKVM